MEFHDPRAATRVEDQPYTLGIALKPGVTLGLLANGFPDSENFLNAVSSALTEHVPGIALKSWNKGNASVPASDETLAEIEQTCDAAIAAYGH